MVSKTTLIGTWVFLLLAFVLILNLYFRGSSSVGSSGWLSGPAEQKFSTLSDQHGGFGITMWEVAYRYGELAWAKSRGDWDYADHQLEEMRESLLRGIERRPARAKNTHEFITTALNPLSEAIQTDPENLFETRFQMFKSSCILCHANEDAPLLNMNSWFARFE